MLFVFRIFTIRVLLSPKILLALMKRPRIFCFVAAWCCLGLLMQASYLTRPAKAYQAAGMPVPQIWNWLPLVALGFVIWQTVGLVRLRPCLRWFAVAFFAVWPC